LTKNISNYSRLYGAYNGNYLAFQDLVERISVEEGFSEEIEREIEDLLKQQRALAADEEPGPSMRLLKKFQAEVNSEIPPQSLWCPPTSVRTGLILMTICTVYVIDPMPSFAQHRYGPPQPWPVCCQGGPGGGGYPGGGGNQYGGGGGSAAGRYDAPTCYTNAGTCPAVQLGACACTDYSGNVYPGTAQ
jgi:hypothetical protein